MTWLEIIHIVAMAALAVLIIISLFWWVFAIANGIFALGPFLSLMAGITIAGLLSDKEQR